MAKREASCLIFSNGPVWPLGLSQKWELNRHIVELLPFLIGRTSCNLDDCSFWFSFLLFFNTLDSFKMVFILAQVQTCCQLWALLTSLGR